VCFSFEVLQYKESEMSVSSCYCYRRQVESTVVQRVLCGPVEPLNVVVEQEGVAKVFMYPEAANPKKNTRVKTILGFVRLVI
jgi:predicted secreted protein